MSAAATLNLESKVLNALDSCIRKMSDYLNREFDPADKQSMSLFRQFCSALRSRVQWMKSYFADDLASKAKAALQCAEKTQKALASAEVAKNDASAKKESPNRRGLIEETDKFGPKAERPATHKGKVNGLLRKF